MENAPPLRPNSPLAQAKRLVILRFDKLGDTILALPCLRWLERHLPTAQTTIVASPLGAPVLAREKSEVKIFDPQSNNLQADLGAYLKSQDFDILFCFTEKGFALKASGQSQIPHRSHLSLSCCNAITNPFSSRRLSHLQHPATLL